MNKAIIAGIIVMLSNTVTRGQEPVPGVNEETVKKSISAIKESFEDKRFKPNGASYCMFVCTVVDSDGYPHHVALLGRNNIPGSGGPSDFDIPEARPYLHMSLHNDSGKSDAAWKKCETGRGSAFLKYKIVKKDCTPNGTEDCGKREGMIVSTAVKKFPDGPDSIHTAMLSCREISPSDLVPPGAKGKSR